MKNSKLKVKHRKKSYDLNQSPLYRMKSKKKLGELLSLNHSDVEALISKKEFYYNCFYNEDGRYIESPISLMYKTHNKLANFFSRISTPSYMHFAKKGRSNITNANAHSRVSKTITFDIKNYYTNITQEKIKLFFIKQMECSPDVAYILSQLCTYNKHLPTGSQISVYLCNLTNIKMFNELNCIAESENLNFTVFADDITISGENAHSGVLNTMSKVLSRYKYTISKEKTKKFRSNQIPLVTGIALNNKHTARNKTLQKTREVFQKMQRETSPIELTNLKNTLRGKSAYFRMIQQPIPKFLQDCLE